MVIGDFPQITDTSHSHTLYSGDMATARNTVGTINQLTTTGGTGGMAGNLLGAGLGQAVVMPRRLDPERYSFTQPQAQENFMAAAAAAPTRRIVQVFIADPDENVPLDKSLLYTGPQKLTDATDQELYFEIDIKAILEKHNAIRKELVNKKVKERVEYLEPARVRDLRMVVVNVASF